jgi:hypothetical protein
MCGLYQWLGGLSKHAASMHQNSLISVASNLSSTQKAASLLMILWLGAYPVGCVNVYLGSIIGAALSRLLGSYWFRQYSNDGGFGLLPRIEIPAANPTRKVDHCNDGFMEM